MNSFWVSGHSCSPDTGLHKGHVEWVMYRTELGVWFTSFQTLAHVCICTNKASYFSLFPPELGSLFVWLPSLEMYFKKCIELFGVGNV